MMMPTFSIDGTLTEKILQGRGGKGQVALCLTFALPDGRSEVYRKVSVDRRIEAAIEPGSAGRFYFTNVADMKILAAIRLEDGVSLNLFPTIWTAFSGMLAVLNAAIVIAYIALQGSVRLLPLVVAAVMTAVWATFTIKRMSINSLYRAGQNLAEPSLPSPGHSIA